MNVLRGVYNLRIDAALIQEWGAMGWQCISLCFTCCSGPPDTPATKLRLPDYLYRSLEWDVRDSKGFGGLWCTHSVRAMQLWSFTPL